MKTTKAVIQAEQCSKYLVVLCRHFARKVKSEWTETQGEVEFPVGKAAMAADENAQTLTIVCSAENEIKLKQVQSIIDSHVSMFTRRNPIVPGWVDV
ncbi:DUF2218 domain-containing protein [Vibrio sonorensis]|uniref:DUF2218 domain-containing protein n=1 Tax=Vibrio sonorensis TaxID=1004316 RepID=UPI0008D97B0D|nr:DUF2218 domain-containing protein [Vibrio sonorensis]